MLIARYFGTPPPLAVATELFHLRTKQKLEKNKRRTNMTKEEALQFEGDEDDDGGIISLDSSFFVNRKYFIFV
jgi:hypothetical protein